MLRTPTHRTPRLTGILLLAFAFGGCGPEDPTSVQPFTEPFGVSSTVTPEGGALRLGDATITVPPGAVDAPVELTVTEHPEGVPGPYIARSAHYVFGPRGTRFATPATISLPFDGDDAPATAFWQDERGGFRTVPTDVIDGRAFFTVDRLSSGFIADPLETWAVVPEEGGRFLFAGDVAVTVPPDASDGSFILTVVAADVPSPYDARSDRFLIDVDHGVLDLPIEVEVPFTGPGDEARRYVPDGPDGYRVTGGPLWDGVAVFALEADGEAFVAAPMERWTVPAEGGRFPLQDLIVTIEEATVPFDLRLEAVEGGTPPGFDATSPLYVVEHLDGVLPGRSTVVSAERPADEWLYVPNGHGGWRRHVVYDSTATFEGDLPESFFFGRPGEVEEVWAIPSVARSDVLFVVDDSLSMVREHGALAAAMPGFVSELALLQADVRVAATHFGAEGQLRTIVHDGAARTVFDAAVPGLAQGLGQLVAMPATAGLAQGRQVVYRTLEENAALPAQRSFRRPDAQLHVVLVSDRGEASTTPLRHDYRRWLRAHGTPTRPVRHHAIVGIPGMDCPAVVEHGSDYIQYANWTGGLVGNACDADWDAALRAIAAETSGKLIDVRLDWFPDAAEPITLTRTDVSGQATVLLPHDFTRSGTWIDLVDPLQPGESLTIGYTPE